ncbi:MAG TPA: hypothetical protein VGK74_18190 [Symbiobacteriaceae bacterium]|jgi:hypothetical protein
MTELDEMTNLLEQASSLLRQAADAGARARSQGPEARRAVDREWEAFLGGFISHLKQKGREQGENLLAGISFSRVLAWGK